MGRARTPLTRSGSVPRFMFGLLGEGAQSSFHFLVNVALIRALSAHDYGVFALVFTLGSLTTTYVGAAAALPAAVGMPRLEGRRAQDARDVVLGSVATAMAAIAASLLVPMLWAWTGSAATATAAGAAVGGWAVRFYVRAALFARHEPRGAARSDLAFAAVGAVGLGLAASLSGGLDLARAFAALAFANGIGIATALASTGRPVRLSLRPSVRRRYRVIFRGVSWSLVGVTTANLQSQFQAVLVAGLAGPAAFAPLAAALVLQAPLRLATTALVAIVQPDFARLLGKGDGRTARRLLAKALGAVAGAGLAYAALLALTWPLIRAQLFGRFEGAPMELATALAWAISVLYLLAMLPKAFLEAAGDFRLAAGATAVGAFVVVPAVAALLAIGGPTASLAGMVLSEAVTLAILAAGAGRVFARLESNRLAARALAQPGNRRLR